MRADLNKLSSRALSAAMRGGTDGWGQRGSDSEHIRYMEPSKSRKRCPCCGNRASHVGMANGVALTSGCEWSVRVWVREGQQS